MLILNTTIFISSRFRVSIECRKALGTTVQNFSWSFHGADRGGERAAPTTWKILLQSPLHSLRIENRLPSSSITTCLSSLAASSQSIWQISDSTPATWPEGRSLSTSRFITFNGRIHPWVTSVRWSLRNKKGLKRLNRGFPFLLDHDILLCSDGLTSELEDFQIAEILNQTPGESECVARLIEAANDHGGRDNITVILVAAPDDAPAVPRRGDTQPIDLRQLDRSAEGHERRRSHRLGFWALLALLCLIALGGYADYAGFRKGKPQPPEGDTAAGVAQTVLPPKGTKKREDAPEAAATLLRGEQGTVKAEKEAERKQGTANRQEIPGDAVDGPSPVSEKPVQLETGAAGEGEPAQMKAEKNELKNNPSSESPTGKFNDV